MAGLIIWCDIIAMTVRWFSSGAIPLTDEMLEGIKTGLLRYYQAHWASSGAGLKDDFPEGVPLLRCAVLLLAQPACRLSY